MLVFKLRLDNLTLQFSQETFHKPKTPLMIQHRADFYADIYSPLQSKSLMLKGTSATAPNEAQVIKLGVTLLHGGCGVA